MFLITGNPGSYRNGCKHETAFSMMARSGVLLGGSKFRILLALGILGLMGFIYVRQPEVINEYQVPDVDMSKAFLLYFSPMQFALV